MPTPTKPATVLELEKRSHRTKSELDARKRAEASLLTGEKITERKETKNNPIAHREYMRIRRLLQQIEKADALYTGIINRYCMIHAECVEYEQRRERFYDGITALEEQFDAQDGSGPDEMTPKEYFTLLSEMHRNIVKLDSIAMSKRKMLLEIEKECVMTIASALRAIPKKPEEAADDDPMAGLLARGRRA